MSRRHPVPKQRYQNGLGDLVTMVSAGSLITGGSELSAYNTIGNSNNYSLLTLNRIVLTYMFTTNGLFQTALQLPIQDAISRGVELESDELSASDIDTVMEFWDDEGIWDTVLHAATWARLYGGGGVLINTNQDPETPLRMRGIGRSPLELYDVERWQLDTNFPYTEEFDLEMKSGEHMWLLGKKIHESRFILMKGKRAPSPVRRQLRGWGMSEGERMIRELNLYLKTQNVLYEILDESKIDVYHIKGLAQKLMTSQGTAQVAARVQAANEIKNYVNALMLDSEESFEQKTMTFAGLADVSRENRIGVASALRMPVTKLFGMSAAGFSSGEEDLESYNQMVESEIRRPLNRMVKALFDLSFAYLFDYIPKFRFKWPTMRVLTETEHQEVLDKAANRLLSFYDRGLIQTTAVEAEAKKAGIFTTNMNMVINPVPPNGPDSAPGPTQPVPAIKANKKGFFNKESFKEEDHPRAGDGKFGEGGGGSLPSEKTSKHQPINTPDNSTWSDWVKRGAEGRKQDHEKAVTEYKTIIKDKYPNLKKETAIHQQQAIGNYTSNQYKVINEAIKTGKGTPEVQKTVDGLREYIKEVPLADDMIMYRGISTEVNWEPGQTIDLNGFCSMSTSKNIARDFSLKQTGGPNKSKGALMVINAKKGDPIAPTDGMGAYKDKEAEFIGHDEMKFKVVGVTEEGGRKIYQMEII